MAPSYLDATSDPACSHGSPCGRRSPGVGGSRPPLSPVGVPHERIEPALGGPVARAPVATISGLAFDHDEILRFATDHVRREHEARPDPFALLPEPFTLLDLRRLHEAVTGTPLIKDTFRRRMVPHLSATGQVRDGVVGKPARLGERRAQRGPGSNSASRS